MDALEFRLYEQSDRKTCTSIIESQIGAYLAPGEDHDFQAFLDDLANDNNVHFWLAIANGVPVGCGGVKLELETATLCWGIVMAGQLSKGYGRALLLHRLDWIKQLHPEVKSVFCDTAPLTEGFFAKHGFATYRRQPNYWAGSLELVAMELSLDGIRRGSSRAKE